jgi:hypothetical protein
MTPRIAVRGVVLQQQQKRQKAIEMCHSQLLVTISKLHTLYVELAILFLASPVWAPFFVQPAILNSNLAISRAFNYIELAILSS